MTKQDFDKYLDKLTHETGFDLTKEQKAFAYQAAKEYHNQALHIHDVVGRSELLADFLDWLIDNPERFKPNKPSIMLADEFLKSRQ